MFRHILVATDGSPLSSNAIRTAADLARSSGARLTAVNVTPYFRPVYPDWSGGLSAVEAEEEFLETARRESRKCLERAREIAGGERQNCAVVSVESDAPWKAIIDTARNCGCDAIVMASHGRRGLDAMLLGSETHKVVTHCSIPVLVTR